MFSEIQSFVSDPIAVNATGVQTVSGQLAAPFLPTKCYVILDSLTGPTGSFRLSVGTSGLNYSEICQEIGVYLPTPGEFFPLMEIQPTNRKVLQQGSEIKVNVHESYPNATGSFRIVVIGHYDN